MTDPVVAQAEVVIHASPARVWQALTEPDLIEKYLFGAHVETDWQPGSPIVYRGEWQGQAYEDKGVVLEVQPEKRLASTYWSPLSGVPDEPAYYKTVTYELAPEGEGTRVSVTQDNNASPEEAESSSQNWRTVLEGMKAVLEG
ncbi:MAG: SRPBCC domain-containing protein [Anaerolineales bacterium]